MGHNPCHGHHCHPRHCQCLSLQDVAAQVGVLNRQQLAVVHRQIGSSTELQSTQSSDQSWRLQSYVSSVADGYQPGISSPSGWRWQQQFLRRLVRYLSVQGVALRVFLVSCTVLHFLFPPLKELGVVSTRK